MSQTAPDERSVEVFAVQGYIAKRPPVAVAGVTNAVRVQLDLPPFERRLGIGAGRRAELLDRWVGCTVSGVSKPISRTVCVAPSTRTWMVSLSVTRSTSTVTPSVWPITTGAMSP